MADEKDFRVRIKELFPQSAPADSEFLHSGANQHKAPWPQQPQPLEESRLTRTLNTAYDVALCSAPILLIAKIGLVLYAHHLDKWEPDVISPPASPYTTYLIRFNSQLSTLFTIIFMTTVGTFVKRYALWQAEKGATVAKLEQYQASTSLPSTLKMIVSLRSFGCNSVFLLFLWSWFYLGSQAVSREYTYQISGSYHKTAVLFQSAESPSIFQDHNTIKNTDLFKLNSGFSAAIVASGGDIGTSSYDNKKSAILPVLPQSLYGHDQTSAADWQDVQSTYASYSGILVWAISEGIPATTWVGSYDMSSSYVWANCSEPVNGSVTNFPAGSLPGMTTSINATNQTSGEYPYIDVWNRSPTNDSSLYGSCRLERHYVEIKVNCDINRCAAYKFRPATGKPFPSPTSMFLDEVFAQRFFNNLLLSTGVPSNLTDDVLVSDMIGVIWWTNLRNNSTLWTTPGTENTLGQSLSLGVSNLLNTYLLATQSAYPGITGVLRNVTAVDALIDGKQVNATWPRASAKGAVPNPQYFLSIPWVVVDIITCGVLFLTAVSSYWLRMNTFAPDIFGYVSSMTRDNPHMHLPEGGSTMSGIERALALKHVKVKVADVNGDGGVGHIGLAAVQPDVPMGHLQKTKHYM